MDIELIKGDYKSIKSLKWAEIPDFVVVTGKNGSGKTQLLELIHYELGTEQQHKNNVARNPADPFHGAQLKVDNFSYSNKEVIYLPATWSLSNLGGINASSFTNTINTLYNHIIGTKQNAAYTELAQIVSERINKAKTNITTQDVQQNLPLDHFDYINRIQLHEGLNEIFLGYHLKSAELRDAGCTPQQIVEQLGLAPWETINDLLISADFPYEVTRPKGYMGDFNFQLNSRSDPNLVINFSDLSSGEKILISLGIWMFNTGQAKRLPKLLLLDEPDAHLHPSVVKDFINVIEKTLVNKHGVKVIITTHSPTTVSFSPEYSLYEMSKDEPQIRPLESKEYGINLLTEGLVVVKSNNKYVLVEDQDDANYYNAIFSILKNKTEVNPNIDIVFIPSSNKETSASGGNTVVRSWVEKFTREGVFDVFQGLTDLDNGSLPPAHNIHVINRYSLENYLLDPILVFSSLLHDDLTYSVPGIELSHKDEHKLLELPEEDLQAIANHIFSEIEPVLNGVTEADKNLIDIQFIDNKILRYPNWFISYRGHDLYTNFQYKYKKAVNHDNLLKALVRHEFIPADLAKIFREIQQ
ncbi:MAG: AAA family ATPase [Candidatus Thiodiazotropha sp.]